MVSRVASCRGMWSWKVYALHLLCAWSVYGGGRGRSRDVITTQGAARGYYAPRPPHYAYLGLPYASTPTRQQRFKAPEPPPRWDGLFEATHKVKCLQKGSGEENCLVVNVFTPEHATSAPVVVIVHGGNFQTGWGSFDVPSRLLNENFVVVTFNYRLGILGFLCLGVPSAPGNAGLKDQIAALYWVQRNIDSFGGNSGDVTVYGEGSGAEAIQLLILSGLTEGLLHRVVLESGSVLSPSALSYRPVYEAFELAVTLGYNGSKDVDEMSQFFQNMSRRNISNISHIFLPSVESKSDQLHSLLNKDPKEIIKQGNFQKLPTILIFKDSDGLSIMEQNRDEFASIPENFEPLIPNNLHFENNETKARVAELAKEFYFINNNNLWKSYREYFQDILYIYPILKFALLYSSKCSQAVYVLEILDNYEHNEFTIFPANKVIDYFYENENLNYDESVAEKVVLLISNFIKLSDPTPISTSIIPNIWQPVNINPQEELKLKTLPIMMLDRTATMGTVRSSTRLEFWDHIYHYFYRLYLSVDHEFDDLK